MRTQLSTALCSAAKMQQFERCQILGLEQGSAIYPYRANQYMKNLNFIRSDRTESRKL